MLSHFGNSSPRDARKRRNHRDIFILVDRFLDRWLRSTIKRLWPTRERTGVYLAAQVDTLKKLVYIAPEHYRLVVGHAAWEANQLVEQIKAGLWYVLPASPELVFSADEEMWTRGIRRAGTLILQHLTGAKHVPENPLLN